MTSVPFAPAAVVTDLPISGRIEEERDLTPGFTWEEIELLAMAMHHQGSWFLGLDVRTSETAWNVARDTLIALDLLGFSVVAKPANTTLAPPHNEDGPQEVERMGVQLGEARKFRPRAGVTGQAGNSR